jgi:hypothetical protein
VTNRNPLEVNTELSPTYAPTALYLGPRVQWLLHMVNPAAPQSGVCGVTVSDTTPRFLADWPSSFDVCLSCATTHVRRLGAEIIRLQGGG